MTLLVPTFLVVLASIAWWHTEPKTPVINLVVCGGLFCFCYTVAPDASRHLCLTVYASYVSAITSLHLDVLLFKHANMLLTGAAACWYVPSDQQDLTTRDPCRPMHSQLTPLFSSRLVHRAWQTLWKPVPELISVLGVDVPDPPDVSLAGIRADAATLNWTRAPANRSVQKFLIQVNGVVGKLARGNETDTRAQPSSLPRHTLTTLSH